MRVLCSSRQPMTKKPVSGFPGALLSLAVMGKRALESRLCETRERAENVIYILTFVDLSYVGAPEMTPHIDFDFNVFITLFFVYFFQYLEDLLLQTVCISKTRKGFLKEDYKATVSV